MTGARDRDPVGIIGAGHLGRALARAARRAGRSVVIANSRGPESLTPVVGELGAGVSAATPEQAAAAPIVVIALPWDSVSAAVQGLVWDGQIVIDATNDWAGDDSRGRTSSELVAELVVGARVVKAANTLAAEVLGSDPTNPAVVVSSSFRATTPTRRQTSSGCSRRQGSTGSISGTCRQAARCSRSTTRCQASTCSGSRADADRIDRLRSSDESVRLARGRALRTDAARLKSRRAEVPCWFMRTLDGQEIRAFLMEGTRTAKVAVVRKDGSPLVTPVWFLVEADGTIVFTTGKGTVKGHALEHEPRVSICVEDDLPPFAFVRVDGVAELSEDPAELRASAIRIAERYMGAARAQEFGERNAVPGEILVRVRPTHTIGEAELAD